MTDSTPVVVFVRHSDDCVWDGQEKTKKECKCRKHLRWRQDGKQYRRKANTRSWTEAEKARKDIEDKISGKDGELQAVEKKVKLLSDAIDLFLVKKNVEGISPSVVKGYQRLLKSLQAFCDAREVLTVNGVTDEIIINFCATWKLKFPSRSTRVNRRERLRSFLGFCYQNEWLRRIPIIPKEVNKKGEYETETQPLTAAEYQRLIDAVYVTNGDPRRQTTGKVSGRWQYRDAAKLQHAVYAYIQTLRWTGLSPIDTMTLRRDAVTFDAAKNIYHVSTSRNKTGVPVKIPVSKQVGDDLLKVEVGSADYFFWSGQGKPLVSSRNWGNRYIAPVFKAAGVTSEGNMLSYRLRDTFAVHLLEHGASMEDVARLLGNSTRVCEKHYAKWSKLRQDKVDAFVSTTFEQAPVERNRPSQSSRNPNKE
jgi:site-specific recombinase XerD